MRSEKFEVFFEINIAGGRNFYLPAWPSGKILIEHEQNFGQSIEQYFGQISTSWAISQCQKNTGNVFLKMRNLVGKVISKFFGTAKSKYVSDCIHLVVSVGHCRMQLAQISKSAQIFSALNERPFFSRSASFGYNFFALLFWGKILMVEFRQSLMKIRASLVNHAGKLNKGFRKVWAIFRVTCTS